MNTSTKKLFLTMTILSTIMVMSSSTWMNMWIGMEINLMSFIPLMSNSKNPFLSQSSMMYFLIQSLASMLFIMTFLMNKMFPLLMKSEITMMMIMLSMMMKMGVPPFHMWFPEVMNKIDWKMCFILMTWQKIAPMYVMSTIISMKNIVILMICMSALVGAIGGLNQTSTRKMMAYSSINHMSWMISCAAMFKKSWIMYLSLYMLMMTMLCMVMNMYNILYINQMNIFFMKNMDKIIIIMMMLSIGGIPPFIGFLPKWITIQYMISSSELLMMMIMVVSSLVTMSYYLRMIISMNMIMSHSQKWMMIISTNKTYSMYLILLNMMMPMLILFLNF